SWTWNAVAGASSYDLYEATSAATLIVSAPTAGYVEVNLSTNTPYGRMVTAVVNGAESVLSASATAYTSAATPGQPGFSAVAYTSFTVTWADQGNPSGTPYEVSRSTDPTFATATSTPIAFSDDFTGATTAFIGLKPSTTYYVRVRAENGAASPVVTAFSLVGWVKTLDVAVPSGLSGTALGISSISWTWNAAPGAGFYNLYAAGSLTLVVSTPTPGYVETALGTNVDYSRVVTAVVNGLESALSPSTATFTLADQPGAAVFSDVGSTALTFTWAVNTNPAATPFEVSVSTDGFALNFSTPVPIAADYTGNAWTLSSLPPGTPYSVRIRAQNGDDIFTGFSVVTTTVTLPPPPTGFSGSALGVSSISWTWNPVTNAASYQIYLATSPATLVAQVTGANSYDEVNLSTNTVYGRYVTVIVGGRESGLSNSATTYTMAAVPSQSQITADNATSVAMAWNSNTNPAGTRYVAEISLSPSFASVTTSTTLNASAIFSGLNSNATYYLQVEALNGDGFGSGFDTVLTTITPAAEPVNGQFITVSFSSITITWGGSTNALGTDFQAELSTAAAFGGSGDQIAVGTDFTTTFPGLQPATTYYARVKALGWTGFDSPYLVIGTAFTGLATPQNLFFSDVELSSVTLAWTAPPEPTIQYVVELAPNDPFATILTSTTLAWSAGFAGLGPNALYFARVRAQDQSSLVFSAYSNAVSTYTLADPPTGLTAALSGSLTTRFTASLAWDGNGNPSGTIFTVERSTDNASFSLAGTGPSTSFSDSPLAAGTTFYYRVRAFNGDDVPTAYSGTATVATPAPLVAPMMPGGFWAEGRTVGDTFQITYHWRDVTQRTDGSPLTNLAGYQVYASSNILIPESQWVLVATAPADSWSTSSSAGSPAYYAVRAYDTNNLESAITHAIDDSAELNHYFLGPDGVTRAQIPQMAADILRQERNAYGTDLTLEWEEVPAEETGRVVRSMTLQAVSADSGNEVPGVSFSPPVMIGVIAYAVANGQVLAGAPQFGWMGTVSQPVTPFQTTSAAAAATGLIPASQAAGDLSLFWFNGVEWVKSTGEVQTATTVLSFTGSRLGRFQIRVASHAPSASQISLTKVYPRIISPNSDGWNDKAIFQFDDPQGLPLSGQVFDITGAAVASLAPGPNPDTLQWDGKDRAGRVVPAGVYLYQVIVDGSAITGTVVVAR
ncbi:MAG TPA: fibronectin type III domain-containing protein, partial [Elusimicrobiota bacterium]|nr:fibronectin type III domain-containing protein [Elusimicrobiota bacterium]